MRFIPIAGAFVVALIWLGPAQPQQQQQPSAGGTPEQMPFNIPYGTDVTLERAKQLIAAAEVEGNKRGWKMNIAVVDTHGDLVHFSRMDGAQLASINIAQ